MYARTFLKRECRRAHTLCVNVHTRTLCLMSVIVSDNMRLFVTHAHSLGVHVHTHALYVCLCAECCRVRWLCMCECTHAHTLCVNVHTHTPYVCLCADCCAILCVCACLHLRMRLRMDVCVCVCVYLCIFVFVFVCVLCLCVYAMCLCHAHLHVCAHAQTRQHIRVFVYAGSLCTQTHIQTHTHTAHGENPTWNVGISRFISFPDRSFECDGDFVCSRENLLDFLVIRVRTCLMCTGARGGGLGSRPNKMYGERFGDGVEYHLMRPTPRR